MSTVVSHLAGGIVQFGTLMRQRCEWCGAALIDEDLSKLQVPEGQDPTYPHWEAGTFVDVDAPDQAGGIWSANPWAGGRIPETACLRMPPEAT